MKDKANKGYWQRLAKIYAPLMESDKKFYNAICGYIRDYLKSDMYQNQLVEQGSYLSHCLIVLIAGRQPIFRKI